MAASGAPPLSFIIRPEYYATLTIETLISQAVGATAGGAQLSPPVPQPVLDISQGTIAQNPGQATLVQVVQALISSRFSKPWLSWFIRFQSVLAGVAASDILEVIAPSVDETDIGWFGNGTIDDSTDPVSFTATLTGASRFPMQITVTMPGSGYTSAPTVTITDANGNTNGAAATAVLNGDGVQVVEVSASGYGLVPPLTVAFTGGGGTGAAATANLGRQWGVGDFIIWNDPTITSGIYGYEIDQITAITYGSLTSGTFKVARAAAGATAGQAQFGSPLAAHASINFYRLINKGWDIPIDPTLGPQLVKLFWDNMTVAAVLIGQGASSSPVLINLAPVPYTPGTMDLNPRLNPPAPGMRTMNGAAYTTLGISGALTVGATSAARISAQAWESVRTVYAKVQGAPAGATSFGGDANACVVIWVCYIAPPDSMGNRAVGLLDCLVVDSGKFTSYADTNSVTPPPNVPDGRQMPYHGLSEWVRTPPLYDWPPNYLPVLAGALSADGALQLGTPPNMPNAPSGTDSVQFSPDGEIDFVVGQIGTSTAGSNLIVTVQT